MILPIIAYGDPVLKKKAADITKDYPNLTGLLADMFETMKNAKGVGLAAPQIGLSIRLFIIDASAYYTDSEEEEIPSIPTSGEAKGIPKKKPAEDLKNFKKVFINARIIEEDGEKWKYNEGCLSIPTIREDVERKPTLRVKYSDENFVEHEESFEGLKARIIQHEYDHTEGILFTDRINPLRKRLLKRKLTDLSKGIVEVSYKMKFPLKK